MFRSFLFSALLLFASVHVAAECRIQYGFVGDDRRGYSAYLTIQPGSTVEIGRVGVIWLKNLRASPVRFELRTAVGLNQMTLRAEERDPRTDRYGNPATLERASCMTPRRNASGRPDLVGIAGSGERGGVLLIDGKRQIQGRTVGGRATLRRVVPSTLCEGIPRPGLAGTENRVSQGVQIRLSDYRWGFRYSGNPPSRPFKVRLMRGDRRLDERIVQPGAIASRNGLNFATPRERQVAIVHRVGNDPGCWTEGTPGRDSDNAVFVVVDPDNAIAEAREDNNRVRYRPPRRRP